MRVALLRLLASCTVSMGMVFAGSAPAPLLQSPNSGATNVDPDAATLTWRWVDDLMVNGSFETGLSPGWSTGGQYPSMWQIYTSSTYEPGIGYKVASAPLPVHFPTWNASLMQDVYIPADAISATLQWKERLWNLVPSYPLLGRLRVWLAQGGTAVALLEDVQGNEFQFLSHDWVSRSTNLLAFAGQSLQLVIRADGYAPLAATAWYADVDTFSFSCEYFSSLPEFQVYLGKSGTLRSTNLVGDLSALNFTAPALDPLTTYYWRVGAVRDGVTNYSSTRSFKTGQRVLPQMIVTGHTPTGVLLAFPSRADRSYTVEQRDSLDNPEAWYDILPLGQGNGGTMEAEVPFPVNEAAFWRLRVTP